MTLGLPANRTGLAGSRALAVVVTTPGKLVAPAGILSRIMLPDDDVGNGIEVGVVPEAARGLNKVDWAPFVGDKIT